MENICLPVTCISHFLLLSNRWVDQCAGAHDANRRTEKYSSVGQNWAARYGGNHDDSSALADFMVEAWYDEVSYDKRNTNR